MFTGSSLRTIVTAVLILGLVGCGSAKKKDGEGGDLTGGAGAGAPSIESTPMNFNAQGSDSGQIQGLETIHFEYDRSVLTSDGKKKAQMAADWLKSNTNANLQIEGHCDSRGSIEYNLSLGERRANAVLAYMGGLGVNANRMSVISYGKEKPIAPGDSEADHRKNRRANFVPLSK